MSESTGDLSVDGAYLSGLFVCRTVTESPRGHSFGEVFDHLIADDPSLNHEVTVVVRLYGRVPPQGWHLDCRIVYPNETSDRLFDGDIEPQDKPLPLLAFFPISWPTKMPGMYYLDALINGRRVGRSAFFVTREGL